MANNIELYVDEMMNTLYPDEPDTIDFYSLNPAGEIINWNHPKISKPNMSDLAKYGPNDIVDFNNKKDKLRQVMYDVGSKKFLFKRNNGKYTPIP